MRKVTVFNFVTLNGYFGGPKRDISWHKHGAEENEYAGEAFKSGSTLLFGRVTYEMMASYWPTPDAIKNAPVVAGRDMTLLGSGSILSQFAAQGLIDEYQIMVDPVVLGDGTPIFKGIKHTLNLKLISTRTFKSGVVLLCYQPVEKA